MVKVATLSSKGQITIPKAVRSRLRLKAGDKLEFVLKESGGVTLRPVTKKVDEVFGRLRRKGQKPVSAEEMDMAIEKEVSARRR